MAEALVGNADRLIDAVDEIGDVDLAANGGLHDGEFVAAQPDHEVGLLHASGEASGDRFEQFVADHVAERVVDALEFVNVDIEHGELPLVRSVRQLALDLLAKQGAVRQIGQRIIMSEVGDAFLGAAALGDVLMGRDPAAVRQSDVVITIALRWVTSRSTSST